MSNALALTVPRDGGPGRVTKEDLRALIGELDTVRNETGEQLLARSRDSLAARFCLWKGQSADGRRHAKAGADAFPYDGAPDTRVRLIDFLIGYYVGIYGQAMKGAARAVQPMELSDAGYSGKMQLILNWILENLLGDQLPAELEMLLNWMEGDTPAAAIAGIYWDTDTNTETRTLTAQALAEILAPEAEAVLRGEGAIPSGDQADDMSADAVQATAFQYLQDLLTLPAREADAIALIRTAVPEVDVPRARQMLREIRETGQTTYPAPAVRFNGPRLCAHRLYEDIFIPGYTQGIQRAPAIFVREMLTEAELRERETTLGYSRDFVQKLLGSASASGTRSGGFAGESFLNETYTTTQALLRDQGLALYPGDEVPWRGHYEVITAWYRATNAFGVNGVYYVHFSHCANLAAHERKLSGMAHGKYPFVAFTRERLSRRLIDSRSIADLALTDQLVQKKLTDTTVINAELKAMPPVVKDWNIQKVLLGPFAQNDIARGGAGISFLPVPPAQNDLDKVMSLLDVRTCQYFGIPHPQVPAELTQTVLQRKIDNVLSSWRECLVHILQLAQQYMPEEQLRAISGSRPGIPVAASKEEIKGRFNITISFDARTLSLDWLKELMTFAKDLVALDSQGVVVRERLIATIARAFGSNLADTVLQDVEVATEAERRKTEQDIQAAFSGIMPADITNPSAGVNFRVRQQRLDQWYQENPFALKRAPADTKQILRQYQQYLDQGVAQQENAVIGRIGTRPDLDLDAVREQIADSAEPAPAAEPMPEGAPV